MKISMFLFKYRSYIPIPFILLMLIGENANPTSLIIGFSIAILGEALRLWGVSWAGSETRTTENVGGTFLIVSGPYAYVRNPLYVGNIMIYTGIGIASYAFFPYLQIAGLLFFSFQYYMIVKEEEAYLKVAFKEEYQEFTKNVNRFFPKLKAYKKENAVQPSFSLTAGLKSENRSLQSFSIVSIVLLAKYIIRIYLYK